MPSPKSHKHSKLSNISLEKDTITGAHTYAEDGSYDISLTIIDDNGCSGSVFLPGAIIVEPMPFAAFTYNSSFLNEEAIDFINLSGNANTYEWDFGDGNSSTSENPNHIYDEQENYLVELIATGAYEDCKDTSVQSISASSQWIYFVPNSFTPDGDSFNHVFKPIMSSGIDPYDYKLTIFNRWGEIIFVSYDYNIGWDGTYLGGDGLVQDGVYIWQLEFGLTSSDEKILNIGHVLILK